MMMSLIKIKYSIDDTPSQSLDNGSRTRGGQGVRGSMEGVSANLQAMFNAVKRPRTNELDAKRDFK